MKKQEAIEKLESRAFDIEDTDLVVGLRFAQNTVKQIDEPKKAVIPQFVADWLEVCKENLAIGLFFAMTPDVLEVNNQSAETIYWLKSARNQETFAKAWLYGYEIEKEKLYTVKFSNEDFGKFYIGIFKAVNKFGISSLPLNDDDVKSWFTEDELERFKFWNNPAFEIKEVTE